MEMARRWIFLKKIYGYWITNKKATKKLSTKREWVTILQIICDSDFYYMNSFMSLFVIRFWLIKKRISVFRFVKIVAAVVMIKNDAIFSWLKKKQTKEWMCNLNGDSLRHWCDGLGVCAKFRGYAFECLPLFL